MRNLTGRELRYLGTRCQNRPIIDGRSGSFNCMSPVSHRVQLGPYGWWFVCFDHIETTVERGGSCKPSVKMLVPSREAAEAASVFQAIIKMRSWARR